MLHPIHHSNLNLFNFPDYFAKPTQLDLFLAQLLQIINIFKRVQVMGRKVNPKLTPQQIKQKKIEKKQRQKQTKIEIEAKKDEVRRLKQQRLKNEAETGEAEPVNILQENQNILTGKYYDHFQKVFEKNQSKALRYYQIPQEAEKKEDSQSQEKEDGDEKKGEEKYSRKQKKKMRWLKVAQLKALVKRPDLVEAWDITAPDPLFLLELKTLKNTIAVPRHWNQKSKFLQTKRGILKPMFKLPEYIEATGISKLRDPFSERDGQKMVKQKLRERMNPKLGKIDIDYQVLHDAFFKYQLKSNLTVFGDIYYEGKQDEAKAKEYKPGIMSETLRIALGITDYQAPPWIINMQRYGAPPSYPTLRILGSTLPFSQLTSYSVINKTNLEETAKKLGQPGLYATFKTYNQNDEEQYIDRGYWGEINNMDDILDEEPPEGWEEDNEGVI